jgi:nitroreductase
MEVYEAVIKRRSIREFKDKPVPYEVLEKCVNAARLAPSAGNRQLLEHVIVDDKNLLLQVFDSVASWFGIPRPKEGWPPGRRPTAYIVTLINLPLEKEIGTNRVNTNYDVGTAAENIAIVALEQRIGSCIVSAINRPKLKQVVNIPDKYEIAVLLAVGYPDESPVLEVVADPVTRWADGEGVCHIPKRELKDILHRNRFK